mgnify:CR=1 FL=1|jgi:thymidylate synthase|tara:strand:+ start:776 stop:1786 length:1011 start_codon:yes stop_codon:yes gene_type:complete
MKVLNVRNAHDALLRGLDFLYTNGVKAESRNGVVFQAPTPVTTVYSKPKERVLFWKERNANPFFHFMEALWMIKGGYDLEFVYQYNKRMKEFSDDGQTLHGAYGWRWRSWFFRDQIPIIIKRLKENPEDRRSVLQMWDPVEDLDRDGADVPCNTCVYFKIDLEGKLQMTVCNRSNDIIWGAYGANVVHMSMLQEYMATAIGVSVGKYYQISDNYHAYNVVFEPLLNKFIEQDAMDFFTQKRFLALNPYTAEMVKPYPIVNTDIQIWDLDLLGFFDRKPFDHTIYEDPFFTHVAAPIQNSWWLYKSGQIEEAMIEIQECKADDWRKACWEWLGRKSN